MGTAARAAGVAVVAGDTKVVEQGSGDGLFITTTGVGLVPDGVEVGPERARPGDVVLVSGPVGDHGDSHPQRPRGPRVRRGDRLRQRAPARARRRYARRRPGGGQGAARPHPRRAGGALNELAIASSVAIELQERAIPVRELVASASALLGLDPLYVPCEGRLTAIVDPDGADRVLAAMRADPHGEQSCAIGTVADGPAGLVTARTGIGGVRVIDLQIGEQLPRIC